MNFNYYIPTKLLFGKGQLNNLHLEKLPGKKALIVISSGKSIRENGYLERVEKELTLAGVSYAVFDKILPNPIKSHVMEGAAFAKENGCDFVIGLGGGSSIDSAKSIAVMAANEGDYWDYISGGSGKGLPVPNSPLPVVAITTTAGTGTEVDPWTVVTKEDTEEKIGFGYEKTFPVLSVVDPDLMLTVPPHLTAYQGFDALFHSTEGYINKTAYVMSDLYALKAIELIGRSLSAAVNNGKDEKAREDVALANTLSGMVESTSGCTSEHSLEHALSAYHPSLPHGAGLIMISCAYYTHFAKSHSCDDKLIAMAKALGKTDANDPIDFVTALAELQKACGVSELKMSDYGIKEEELMKYVGKAYETMGGLFEVDPAPLTKEDCFAILKASYR
ncbi:iron-containing alcohol dehydrogenase [Anaerocolumna xylanovorans]|uniref:Alcohol dehydrogenase, class IV n=1 Tax=Anaerocolumna xylanovorans DSM 12503 TaxID=1121345 RepID=A0A1M7Y938_9FIRM|nr:iron-containing alcohol dehydrogenase [Anaerocolumna xylanovorans]SHO49152.1 Alcohol dehydrogenase, class IV [Anaerocolumna xylanovorans DSM 12503]